MLSIVYWSWEKANVKIIKTTTTVILITVTILFFCWENRDNFDSQMFEITFKKTAKRRTFKKSRFSAKTKIRSIYSQHWKYNLKDCSIDKIQWTSLLIGYCPSLNCTIKKKIPINKNLSNIFNLHKCNGQPLFRSYFKYIWTSIKDHWESAWKWHYITH